MAAHPLVDIPLIDFAPFLRDDLQGQQRVTQAIFRACHEIGFLYLCNHGIPQALIDRVFEQSRAFFALPLAEKQKLAWASELSNRGYVAMERERLDETQPGDLKEAFNMRKVIAPVTAITASSTLTDNCWPADNEIFQQCLDEFFGVCTTAAIRLFRAFAIALSMPADYLVACHQSEDYTLRLLHYPPVLKPPKPGQTRAGAHSDYGTLTLLFQDHVGGLEVMNQQGEWISAPAIPGAVLINTGDLLQRWSNDVFCSTQHRVALTQRNHASGDRTHVPNLSDRYSIAFFCQPDADTLITCLPSCHSRDNPPKYPPVTSGDYLLSRLQATY